jgi:hypothetical protein
MKDYYDVWMLTNTFELDPKRMQRAIEATFARRRSNTPTSTPDGLSDEFSADNGKQRQWDAFARNLSGQVPDLDRVVRELRNRLKIFVAPDMDWR